MSQEEEPLARCKANTQISLGIEMVKKKKSSPIDKDQMELWDREVFPPLFYF